MRSQLSLISAFLLAACDGSAQAPVNVPEFPADRAAELQARLDDWAEQPNHMGVSVAVITGDGAEWAGTAGVAGRGEPLEPHHMMVIASITKTVTGALVMQLAQEGRLSLDDSVGRWLGDMPNVRPGITLRQLLNHTSGVANYTSHPAIWQAAASDPSVVSDPRQMLENYVGPERFEPGARTEYTNTAFVLLGLVAEAVTGQEIAALYRERFWEPLDLSEIYLPAEEPVLGEVATAWIGGDQLRERAPLDNVAGMSARWAAFGLVASSRNVARWARALFRGDVLDAGMKEEMTTWVPDAERLQIESGIGLGIRRYDFQGTEYWGHTGAASDGSSIVLYDPSTGAVVMVAMNESWGPHRSSHLRMAHEMMGIAGD